MKIRKLKYLRGNIKAFGFLCGLQSVFGRYGLIWSSENEVGTSDS